MAKYRKKPVVVEAWNIGGLLTAAREEWTVLPEAISKAYESGEIIFGRDAMFISTLEGQHRGEESDMLIQGIAGEFYPCKSDIFEATYEEV